MLCVFGPFIENQSFLLVRSRKNVGQLYSLSFLCHEIKVEFLEVNRCQWVSSAPLGMYSSINWKKLSTLH